jgi:hypothetical protein
MSELSDTIQEATEHAKESKMNSRVAIWVAMVATFMALCNVKDNNICQKMSQAQANSIDEWSYYQAKSTKEVVVKNAKEMLAVQNKPEYEAQIAKYDKEITRYKLEKDTIQQKAEGFKKEYDDLNIYDDQFDLTDALLSIAIAIFGITALTQKKWLFYFAVIVSIAGFVFGTAAFMGISLHSDFISNILG